DGTVDVDGGHSARPRGHAHPGREGDDARVAGARRRGDAERDTVSPWRSAVLALVLATSLVACAGPAKTHVEAPEPAPAAAPPAPRPVPPPPAPAEAPRQADPLARVASELAELQNAVARLIMSARQHDEQLLYLQRRLTD